MQQLYKYWREGDNLDQMIKDWIFNKRLSQSQVALLTRREFAQRASLSVRKLTTLERRGVVRAIRFNQRVIRFAESELAALPTRIRATNRAETPASIERGLDAHLGKGWRTQC